MENIQMSSIRWGMLSLFFVRFTVGLASLLYSPPYSQAHAEGNSEDGKKKPRIVYPDKTKLNFEGTQIEGEISNPGEFYFQHRPQDKFDSLVKRRKNFHKEMLRDVVLSK